VKNEHGNNRVELECRTLKPKTHGNLLQRPALVNPVCHDLHDTQRHGNRRTLKVLALARRILGDHSNRNVEPRQTRKTAEHEEAQEQMVDGCAQTETEGGGSGANTKGDEVSQGIEFLAHERCLLAPAGDFAVHEVEEETEGDESESEVQVRVVEGVRLRAVAEGGEDGHYTTEAWKSYRQYGFFSFRVTTSEDDVTKSVETYH
jgi:hypothetical protein